MRWLMTPLSRPLSNRKGMTLVEIMIVLAIIGSIMALLLPKIAGAGDRAKQKEAKIQIGQLMNSISMFQSDCGKLPTSLAQLNDQSACSNADPGGYYKVPKGQEGIKDPWGNDYSYTVEGGDYELKSLGKDGGDGGSGYGADISSKDM